MLEFSNRQQHKAKKRHTCQLCGEPILPGNEYIYEAMKYDGELQQLKRHIHCDMLLTAYIEAESPDEYTDDEVWEWIADTVCSECPHNEDGDGECDGATQQNCFSCDTVLEKLLGGRYLETARQSVRDNDESLEGDDGQ